MSKDRHLRVILTAASPAADVHRLVTLVHEARRTVAVTATPSSLAFVEVADIEAATGFPVRHAFHEVAQPSARVVPTVDALIIAPATFNTVNKLAAGIADNYALTAAAELIGRGVPTVIVPFANAALAHRRPFMRSVAALRDEGVRVLFGPDDNWVPHELGDGPAKRAVFPWATALRSALAAIEQSADAHARAYCDGEDNAAEPR